MYPISPSHLFDAEADFTVIERRLPHWSQAGAVCFITLRTCDSMPKSVVDQWRGERLSWLRRHGINPSADWQRCVRDLDPNLQRDYYRTFSEHWHDELGACHGACVLREPELSEIVARSLQHFDQQRYDLTDFVVLPNHVHLLAAFFDEDKMLAQCESWKRYTATRINRNTGGSGRFWQQDGFDHLVRSLEQFEAIRQYIAENGARAGLRQCEYRHYSKQLS